MHGSPSIPSEATGGPAQRTAARRASPWVGVVLVLIAGAVRVAAARGDLWLDEVWSLRLAEQAGSLAGILRLHHDNNHHLVTAWLLFAGGDATPLLARLLSVACGTAAVALVAFLPRDRDPVERLAAAVLVGGSYLLVHYGSEARGYAPAVFFSLAASLALEEHLRNRATRAAALFAGAATLALLSHLTALFAVAGCWAWAAAALARERRARKPRAANLALLALPAAALAALWWIDLRHLVLGGGPPFDLAAVLRDLSRAAFGLPRGPAELLAAVPLALAGLALARMAARRDPRLLLLATLVALPAALLAWRRPDFVAPRYFLVVVPFVLLLAAAGLREVAARGRVGAGIAATALALFALANAFPAARLVAVGRGSYREPVQRMLASTPGVVTVGSDHDFRNGLVLDDQVRRLGAAGRITYLPQDRWTQEAPEWLVLHAFEEAPPAEPQIQARTGRVYGLVATYPYAGLSGFSWIIYRAEAAPGAP